MKSIIEIMNGKKFQENIILNSINDGVWVCDYLTNRLMHSGRFFEIMGYNPDEFTSIDESGLLIHPDDSERMNRHFDAEKAKENPVFNIEYRIKNKTGKYVWFSVKGKAVRTDDGGFFGFGSLTDISDLKETKERLQRVTEGSHDAFVDFTLADQSITASDRFYEILGLPVGSIKTIDQYYDLIHENERADSSQRVAKCVNTSIERYTVEEVNFVKSDGSDIYFTVNLSVTRNEKGEMLNLSGSYQDVTSKKLAEMELSDINSLYSSLVEEVNDYVFVYNREKNKLKFSNNFYDYFGYKYGSLEQLNQFYQIITTDDSSDTGLQCREFFKGDAKSCSGELVLKKSDGTLVYVEGRAIRKHSNVTGRKVIIGSFTDISERKKNEKKLHQFACYDSLTRVPNRRYFTELLEDEVEKTKVDGVPGAVLFIDIDDFKSINDTHGHDFGDKLLIGVANGISSSLPPKAFVGRLGGDEFAIVIPDASKSDLESIGGKLCDVISSDYQIEGEVISTSGSIGIAQYPNDSIDVSELLKFADSAMYASKGRGKNIFSLYGDLTECDDVINVSTLITLADMSEEEISEIRSKEELLAIARDAKLHLQKLKNELFEL